MSEEAPVTDELLAGLEAVLMVADQPVTVEHLSDGLGVEPQEVSAALEELAADYDGERGARTRGFRLARAAGGWRIYSRPEHHDIVSAFLTAGHSSRLSQAALETLAVVAYRQPVTRARISAIRGSTSTGSCGLCCCAVCSSNPALIPRPGPCASSPRRPSSKQPVWSGSRTFRTSPRSSRRATRRTARARQVRQTSQNSG